MTSTRQIATAATCIFVLTSSALHASQTVIEGVSIEAADGSAWEYANNVLTLSGRGPYVLSGACTIGRVQARATCAEGTLLVASNLTLRGGAPLSVAAGASLVFFFREVRRRPMMSQIVPTANTNRETKSVYMPTQYGASASRNPQYLFRKRENTMMSVK